MARNDAVEVNSLIERATRELRAKPYSYGLKLEHVPAGKAILALGRDDQVHVAEAVVPQFIDLDRRAEKLWLKGQTSDDRWSALWDPRNACEVVLRGLLRRKLPLPESVVAALVDWLGRREFYIDSSNTPLAGLAGAVEHFAATNGLPQALRPRLQRVIKTLRKNAADTDCYKCIDRLAALLDDGPHVTLEPGEAWSDAARADLDAMTAAERRPWQELLAVCQSATGSKPTAKWLKAVRPLLDAVGVESFPAHLLRWFPLVDRPRTAPAVRQNVWEPPDQTDFIAPPHADLLKGLAWCCGVAGDRHLAHALTVLAVSAYRKVPGRGPRLVTVGNACIAALGTMPGLDAVGAFVGVASVGNDPTWNDGGPQGHYRDYWHGYSFGELSATARTRQTLLERLVPRLTIADRCSFADRFLVVRDDLRTYKIHLGSGNILMAPDDQYLCIVAKRGRATDGGDMFLPFEGDPVLSVILSKALLLARDTAIADPTITSQIKSR